MSWNPDTRIWEFLGDANVFKISGQRREVIDFLIHDGPKSGPEIARILKKDYESFRQTLYRMEEAEQIGKNQKNHKYYALDNYK